MGVKYNAFNSSPHVTTEISERERLPSLKSLVCLGSLITLVIIISERVLYCLEVASKDG